VVLSPAVMDENLYDVIEDFIEEKREEYEELLAEREDKEA